MGLPADQNISINGNGGISKDEGDEEGIMIWSVVVASSVYRRRQTMITKWLPCGPDTFGERHVLAAMAFLCTFNLYLSRFNLR